jgi:hypothetical protein
MKIKFKLIILLVTILFTSCEDKFEENGIETRIYGRIYDSQNNLALPNHKLKVGEYNLIPGFGITPNIDFIQYLDSTNTDSNGYFDFTFTTSGKGDIYELEIDFDYNNYFGLTNENVFTLGNNDIYTELENLGEDFEINYEVILFFPIKLKIILDNDVEFLPIRISEPYNRYVDQINETNVENTRIYYIDKNSDWEFMLTRKTSNGQNQRVLINMPATNNSNLTEFEFNIKNEDFVDY